MIARGGGGWQTVLADLALILFMVSTAAVGARQDVPADPPPAPNPLPVPNPLPAMAEPTAVYRAATDAPSLKAWLSGQPEDNRQRLTILARFAGGDAARAAQAAMALSTEAGDTGKRARIVIEPGETNEVLAVLAYDVPPDDPLDATGMTIAGQAARGTKARPCGKDVSCD